MHTTTCQNKVSVITHTFIDIHICVSIYRQVEFYIERTCVYENEDLYLLVKCAKILKLDNSAKFFTVLPENTFLKIHAK